MSRLNNGPNAAMQERRLPVLHKRSESVRVALGEVEARLIEIRDRIVGSRPTEAGQGLAEVAKMQGELEELNQSILCCDATAARILKLADELNTL